MSGHAVYQETLSAPKAIIGGREVDAADGRTLPVVSPIDESVIAHLPDCGDAEIGAAVAAARRAFDDRHWAGLAPKERKARMLRWADLIESRSEELAVLQTRDMGMPLRVARAGDIGSAIGCIRWYAEAIDKIYGEIAPARDNETVFIERIPLGVVGAIIPWNFPAMIAAWKLGPALATGNSVVLKPAEDASLVALKLGFLALEAGIPEGVLNVVPGAGSTAGAALALHADVDALTFTGSGRVGRFILEASARSNLKRVSLECGGKSANIIMADTPDLPAAVAAGVRAVFNNQGQVCNAPSRLLVQRPILERVLELVASETARLRLGDPRLPDIDLGPVVNKRQLETIHAAIAQGIAEGCRLHIDGRVRDLPSKGFYIGPTVAADVTSGHQLAQEEIFGPVLSVIAFDTIEEAVRIANGTRYALGAAVWSGSIDVIQKVAKRLLAGLVIVNGVGGVPIEVPFGGFKESGFGRDRSLHALDKYTDLRSIILRN